MQKCFNEFVESPMLFVFGLYTTESKQVPMLKCHISIAWYDVFDACTVFPVTQFM